jgi:HPt (histidine-containing phosphotransfer) domain-containing protein
MGLFFKEKKIPAEMLELTSTVFDHKKAIINMCSDMDLFKDTLSLFLKKMPEYMQNLENAVMSSSLDAIAVAAHTFKGSSRVLGANQIGDILEYVEKNAREKTRIDYNQVIALMRHSIVEFEQESKKFLHQSS